MFLGNHPIVMLTQDFLADEPATHTLMNPYFGMHRIDGDDGEDRATEFNLPISVWMRLFDETGFDVIAYHELRAPRRGADVTFYATADRASDYPTEQVWRLRKR